MNTIIKMDADAKAKLVSAVAAASIKAIAELTKAASDADAGTFDVIVSTEDVDRHGESILVSGWNLENFKANGVVLWAHDYSALPIGICTSIAVDNGKLRAQGKFVPAEANPFAQQVRQLYDIGAVKATSVGLLAEEMQGNTITKAELLEFSFVPVPANPNCLTLAKQHGINVAEMVTKGLFLNDAAAPEEPAAGDEDGDAGEDADEEAKEKTDVLAAVSKLEAAAIAALGADDPKAAIASAFVEAVKEITAILDAEAAAESDEDAGDGTEAEKAITKAGRVLSEKNRELLKTVIDGMSDHVSALKALHEATEPKGGDDEEKAKGRAAAASTDNPELNEFLLNRSAMQTAAKAICSVLENYNRRAKKPNA